ncbi:hypothetical protein BH23VER1_BH23VER1_13460 [soil metagenome]
MPAETHLMSSSDDKIVLQVTVRGELHGEEQIQDTLTAAGRLATARRLEDYDADGSPITVAGTVLSAKRGKVPKKYQSPFGPLEVARYAYQAPSGGST